MVSVIIISVMTTVIIGLVSIIAYMRLNAKKDFLKLNTMHPNYIENIPQQQQQQQQQQRSEKPNVPKSNQKYAKKCIHVLEASHELNIAMLSRFIRNHPFYVWEGQLPNFSEKCSEEESLDKTRFFLQSNVLSIVPDIETYYSTIADLSKDLVNHSINDFTIAFPNLKLQFEKYLMTNTDSAKIIHNLKLKAGAFNSSLSIFSNQQKICADYFNRIHPEQSNSGNKEKEQLIDSAVIFGLSVLNPFLGIAKAASSWSKNKKEEEAFIQLQQAYLREYDKMTETWTKSEETLKQYIEDVIKYICTSMHKSCSILQSTLTELSKTNLDIEQLHNQLIKVDKKDYTPEVKELITSIYQNEMQENTEMSSEAKSYIKNLLKEAA